MKCTPLVDVERCKAAKTESDAFDVVDANLHYHTFE